MNTDKELVKARAQDLFRLCQKRGEAQFSDFLDSGEAACIEDELDMPYGFNTMLFGGYEGAERQVLGVFPEWEEASVSAFPISVIRFDAPKFRTLTHRDYLGTIMSLGIERGKTGDILTDDGGAYVMAESTIAEYIVRNITKIANSGVKGHIIELEDFTAPEPEMTEKGCVAASLRLDAVIAAAYNLSRANAEALVKEERVKVNHRIAISRSVGLNEGDLVSVRGHGRFILKSIGRETQKGRLHITVGKFV